MVFVVSTVKMFFELSLSCNLLNKTFGYFFRGQLRVVLKKKSKRKQEMKGKDNKKKKALFESDDDTDNTLNNGKEDIKEGKVAEKVKNVAAKKGKKFADIKSECW